MRWSVGGMKRSVFKVLFGVGNHLRRLEPARVGQLHMHACMRLEKFRSSSCCAATAPAQIAGRLTQ